MDVPKANPLPKFDGRDFGVWKAQVEAYLTAIDKSGPLTGKIPRKKYKAPDGEVTEREQLREEFDKDDKYVKAILFLSLDTTQARPVVTCSTAKEVWDRLISTFEVSGVNSRRLLTRSFYNIKLKGGESIKDYVARAEYIYHQLVDSGNRHIKDSDLIDVIIGGLTPPYLPFTQSWSTMESKKQTLSELISLLQFNEAAIVRAKSYASEAIFNIEGPQGKKNKNNQQQVANKSKTVSWKATGACYGCGSTVHRLGPECPKYDPDYKSKKGNKKEQDKSKPQASSSSGESKKDKPRQGIDEHIMNIEEEEISLVVEDQKCWMYDTGASSHVCRSRSDFFTYKTLDIPVNFKLGGVTGVKAIGIGTVKLRITTYGKDKIITLKDVYHIPDIRRNIISAYKTKRTGVMEEGCIDYIRLHKDDETLFVAHLDGKLYFTYGEVITNEINSIEEDNLSMWHERCCHINKQYIINSSKAVIGMDSVAKQKNLSVMDTIDCIPCCKGKLSKKQLPLRTSSSVSHVGERIHSDIGGPVGVATFDKFAYYVIFKDEYSSFRFAYLMKSRSEAYKKIEEVIRRVKADANQDIRYFFSDRGSEYTSTRTQELFLANKIVHQVSAPHRAEQNGIIERENRTLMEGVRTMMIARKVPVYLWGYALLALVHVLNRTVNKKTNGETPYQRYYSQGDNVKRPRVDHLRIFGCFCLYKTQQKKRSGYQKKIEDRGREAIFVGYAQDYTYLVFDLEEKKVVTSHDVQFDESKGSTDEPNLDFIENHLVDLDQEQEDIDDHEEEVMLVEGFPAEPASYKEATMSPDANEWRKAMDEEYNSLIKNETWTLVDLPQGRKAISCKWVYKLKLKNGAIHRYKARLVARGFTQQHGIDYFETFSPVVRLDTIRILLVLANQFNWLITQMDVKTAFLNGSISEEIYMEQPLGYKQGNRVCRLQKSLYGLKQASLEWNKCFTRFLNEFNLKPLYSDSCVYVNKKCNLMKPHEPILVICIYVDDGLIMSNTKEMITACVDHLNSKFEITISHPDTFVGMEISRQDGLMFIGQSNYTRSLIEKYNMNDAHPITVPMASHIKLTVTGLKGSDSKPVDVPYRQLVGSLLYASTGTRPDIAFSVNKLARYCESPRNVHWKLLKDIVRYLKGSQDHVLVNKRRNDNKLSLTCYTDADYAMCQDTRRSTSGVLLLLNLTPIIWKSRRQTITATSTTEAEFVAASFGTKEILWVRNLLFELGASLDLTPLFIDSLGTVKLIENNQAHAKTKHLDIPLHFVRDINSIHTKVEHISTHDNPADLLTKALSKPKFELFTSKLVSRRGTAMSILTLASIFLLCGQVHSFLLKPPIEIQPYEIEVQSWCPCELIMDERSAPNRDEHHANPDSCKLRATWDHLECVKRYDHILEYCRRLQDKIKRSIMDDIYSGLAKLPKIAVSAGTIIIKSLAEVVGVDEILGLTAGKIISKLVGETNSQKANGTLVPIDLTMAEISRVSIYAGEPQYRSKLRTVAQSQPLATRTFEYIYDELSASELLVSLIYDAAHFGKVDTKALSEWSGYDLSHIDIQDTRLRSVNYSQTDEDVTKANITITYVFDARIENSIIGRIIVTDALVVLITIIITALSLTLIYIKRQTIFRRRHSMIPAQELPRPQQQQPRSPSPMIPIGRISPPNLHLSLTQPIYSEPRQQLQPISAAPSVREGVLEECF